MEVQQLSVSYLPVWNKREATWLKNNFVLVLYPHTTHMCICTHACGSRWRPEEDIRVPGCKLPDLGAWNQSRSSGIAASILNC